MTIHITLGDPDTQEPAGRALVTSSLVLGGLAATLTVEPWGHTMLAWTVTHVASGLRLTRRPLTQREADGIVRALQGVTDWTVSAEKVRAVKDLERRMREVAVRVMSEMGEETP